jgi:hypothetical protein
MSSLSTRLTELSRAAFSELKSDYPRESFCFFALYTTESGSYAVPTAWSEEALEATFGPSPEDWDLRLPADSPYHAFQTEGFESLKGGPALHRACFDALSTLDGEGLFGRSRARSNVILNVVYGDMSDGRWLEHARRLNPPAAVARVEPLFETKKPSGNTRAWGIGVYEAVALALSADRRVVAFCGDSDGLVAAYRTGRRPTKIIEKRLRGARVFRYDCTLSPDGDLLYMSGADISVFHLKTSELRRLVEVEAPTHLSLSPDGTTLAVGFPGGSVRLYSVENGACLWERGPVAGWGQYDRAYVAFSPRGHLLAVGGPTLELIKPGRKTTVARFKTGIQTGYGRDGVVAWSADGSRLAYRSDKDDGIAVLRWPEREIAYKVSRQAERSFGQIKAISFSPSGHRLAFCAGAELHVASSSGKELARAWGSQEDLYSCVFVSEDIVLAGGRDVDKGPAILQVNLSVSREAGG